MKIRICRQQTNIPKINYERLLCARRCEMAEVPVLRELVEADY